MKLRISIQFLLFFAILLLPMRIAAQEYSVSYKEQNIEQVIADLQQQTGYKFIYQKQILHHVSPITCTLNNVTLDQLLNRIFINMADLSYKIEGKNVLLSTSAQRSKFVNGMITGVVTDEKGEVLPGASIRLEGTNVGTVTDVGGRFSILVKGNNPLLRISYVGMKEQIVSVSRQGGKALAVRLQNDSHMMNEVLVTGYQNLKRENATGAYQSISSKEIEDRYTGSVVGNLEGRIPGLVSYNNGMNDGGESSLVIRGSGSFQAKTNPLVVVDGLPIEGSIETVNPYDIANITVLKDASAAAIYGARASNGVIVVTTKRGHGEKLSVDFNTDLTISEKQDYSNFRWANAEEMIELEKYNFDSMRDSKNQDAFTDLLANYHNKPMALSPVSRLLVANNLGELSDQDLNSRLSEWSQNDYRKEWQKVMERPQVVQQYNLALRTQGKSLASSIVLNYKGDNNGIEKEFNRALTLSYRGDLKATSWLDLSFGTNIISERSKTHIGDRYSGINSFQPYQSMYNEDGSEAGMEADVYLGEESLKNSSYGFKPVTYNLLDEVNMNFQNARRTNIRSFVHADFKLLPEWHFSTQFQYEDIYYKSDSYYEPDSYYMRYMYDLYTAGSGGNDDDESETAANSAVKHYIPDGGLLETNTSEGGFYTFRAQTDYNKTFGNKHEVDAIAGFEFRQSKSKTYNNLLLGYDDQTQTNSNGLVDFGTLKNMEGTVSALGPYYTFVGAPDASDFSTSDVLHRFYSLYFSGNYVYDRRYAASFSYRVDKTDLFGADPKFRGRPLWSAGLSWNINNEAFMKKYTWIDALKLRASYGLTGNIDQDVSSYLTATIGTNEINGKKVASLNTPPNDQLRWEKTASWNLGLDFSLWNNRLSGSIDGYNKKGTDLLALRDLDPTTGFNQLTINNGEARNTGIELQLNGVILKPVRRNALGINASLNFSYNKNEVLKVSHQPATGSEALESTTLHQGYPIHSLFSYNFAGMKDEDGVQYFTWKDTNGKIHTSDVSSEEFTVDDIVFSGGLDPKYVAGFTPEITYGGFTLSAMFSYYGGNYMRARVDDWSTDGSSGGYGYNQLSEIEGIPSSYLNYWRSDDKTLYPANGYLGGLNVVGNYEYMNTNVVHADYMKLRNLVLGYNFPNWICSKIGVNTLRLRVQINNVATWERNHLGVDPEANNPVTGETLKKTPRSYTMSLYINF